MRNLAIVSVVGLAVLAWSSAAFAQTPAREVRALLPGPGWLTCPRCQNDAHIRAARAKYQVDGHPFDPHNLAGIWGNDGITVPANRTTHTLDHTVVPPLTPYGTKLQEATQAPVNALGFTA